MGRKNDPSFRVIVTDSRRAAKTGSVVEVVGNYDARSAAGGQARPPQFNTDRIKHWLSMGAKVSDTVHNLLIDAKLLSGKKINVLPKNKNRAKIEAEALGHSTATGEVPKEESAELQA